MPPPISTVAKKVLQKMTLDASQKADAHSPLAHPPYESHLVCDFFRQIGRIEVARDYEHNLMAKARKLLTATQSSKSKDARYKAFNDLKALVMNTEELHGGDKATLVGNAQNPLDHLIGDVIGQTDPGRYFIIEFKRYACGFVNETSPKKGKADRIALVDHLLSNLRCAELSGQGHLGAFSKDGNIVFGTYFCLAKDPKSETFQLSAFFDKMQEPHFAWSSDDLLAYLSCMTNHGVEMETDDGQIVFGYVDKSGNFVAMSGTKKIYKMIDEAIRKAQAMQNTQTDISSHDQQPVRGLKPRGQ